MGRIQLVEVEIMAEFQRTQLDVDESIDSGHAGGVALMVGCVFLGMAGFLSIFNFAALRDGDMLWPTYTAIMGFIGIVCVAVGTVIRTRR
jgi:hypothetical protein